MKNLIIFADYGLDDAAATVNIFRHREQFHRITIVPIGGNVPVTMAHANAITLLHELNWLPHMLVDTRGVKQPGDYLPHIHGKDGMGDIFTPAGHMAGLRVDSFDELLNDMTGDEIILSLGPVTLVAELLARHPGCRLIMMGGCIKEAPNHGEYEFNHALDPEAFARCATYPHTVITLDTGRDKGMDIRGIPVEGDDPYAKILRADQALSITRGEDGCFVWDDIAACYLLHPERFITEKVTDPWGNRLTQARYIDDRPYFL